MKRILLFLLVVNVISVGYSQIAFQNNTIIDKTSFVDEPRAIFSADLDNDGDIDLLSASNYDDRVAWFENLDGQGNFSLPKTISNTAVIALSVYATDLDGDGDLDVISSAGGENKIFWYENLNGLGDFGEEIEIYDFHHSDDHTAQVISKDIDNDGDMDIVASGNRGVAWLENTGVPNDFQLHDIGDDNVLYNAYNVYVDDIDNDGDLDIVSASSSYGSENSRVVWYENTDGNGLFSSENILTNDIDRVIDVFIADLDHDGAMDLLYSSSSEDAIYWSKNMDGQGSFGEKQLIFSGFDSVNAVYAEDIDDDGFIDVVSGALYDSEVIWFRNTDGQGNFAAPQLIGAFPGGVNDIISSDIDNDGDLDMFVSVPNADEVLWFENIDGQGNFGDRNIMTYSANDPLNAFSFDIDGDGDLDAISVSLVDKKVSWFENLDGNGVFGLPNIIHIYENTAHSIAVADIDNDGDIDIISSGDNGIILAHINVDGLGQFSTQTQIDNILFDIDCLILDDINNDGSKDIVSVSGANNQVFWYGNNGDGTFGAQQVISNIESFASFIKSADIDGDLDLDIVVSSAEGDRITWFENLDGQGNFGTSILISDTIDSPVSFSVSDIDGDLDLDIIAVAFNDNEVVWYENIDGLGDFSDAIIIDSNLNTAWSVNVGDLDNDGDDDIVAGSNYGGNLIQWYENVDGNGTFVTQNVLVNLNRGANYITIADIDSDGLQDVLYTSRYDDRIGWLKNSGGRNKISGYVHLDNNADGCDDLDIPLSNFMVVAESTENIFAAFPQNNGYYEINVIEGDYTIGIENDFADYLMVMPENHSATFSDLNNEDDFNDFCITSETTINDLNISLFPINEPRPGFDVYYKLVYKNVGVNTFSGTINVEFDDSKLQFVTASESLNVNANVLSYDYIDLNPFETRSINISLSVFAPPTTEIDDELEFTTTINPVSGDETEADNTFVLNQTVIGSYDPNDIRVLEGDQILYEDIDKYLHYIIRFQNTGTASAINVRVEHVLDDKFDWTTMQLESLSHEGRVEIANGSEVSFIFDDINLPDSTNDEPNSHGYIAFKIKPKSDVVVGDVFNAVADIYFDFNPPITTNTEMTEIIETLSLNEFESQKYWIYPNPVSSIFNIKSQQNFDHIRIIDLNGRIVKEQKLETSLKSYVLNLESLNSGMYFLEIESNTTTSILKFVKQ